MAGERQDRGLHRPFFCDFFRHGGEYGLELLGCRRSVHAVARRGICVLSCDMPCRVSYCEFTCRAKDVLFCPCFETYFLGRSTWEGVYFTLCWGTCRRRVREAANTASYMRVKHLLDTNHLVFYPIHFRHGHSFQSSPNILHQREPSDACRSAQFFKRGYHKRHCCLGENISLLPPKALCVEISTHGMCHTCPKHETHLSGIVYIPFAALSTPSSHINHCRLNEKNTMDHKRLRKNFVRSTPRTNIARPIILAPPLHLLPGCDNSLRN